MQNLILYLVGYLLAYFAIRHEISKDGWTRGDAILCLILSLASWISLLAALLIISDKNLHNKFTNN